MSWKPYRGGRVLLDKAVNDSHEHYFKFHETTNFVDKCKSAFKWMKGEKYLRGQYCFNMLGDKFLSECKTNPKTYKPLLRLLETEYYPNNTNI